MKLEELTFDVVEPHVGTTFSVTRPEGGPLPITLASVTPIMEKVTNPRMKRKAFSMVFRGPLDAFLPQMMYPMVHDQLGELSIFIVPVGRYEDGFDYEAVFA